jgi:hypothetical protein
MSYLNELAARVDHVFEENQDRKDLRDKIVILAQSIAKESFKNGCQTARGSKAYQSKGQSNK